MNGFLCRSPTLLPKSTVIFIDLGVLSVLIPGKFGLVFYLSTPQFLYLENNVALLDFSFHTLLVAVAYAIWFSLLKRSGVF